MSTQAEAASALRDAAAVRGAMLPRPFRVRARRQDTADTATLWLEAVDGEPLAFAAGQFTMLHAFGVGEVPISISGDPAEPQLLQHTIRDVGGVTRTLVQTGPGDVLGVRGPYGVGWTVETARGGDVLFVAGGIGLAPLRPALLEVLAHRDSYRRVSLLYGARSPEELLYPPELADWHLRTDLDAWWTVDHAEAGYAGRVGLVTQLLPKAEVDPAQTTVLVCGPEVMMRHVADDVVGLGVPASRVVLSLERNMQCGVGLCGHCQLRNLFLCVDGPVVTLDQAAPLMTTPEL